MRRFVRRERERKKVRDTSTFLSCCFCCYVLKEIKQNLIIIIIIIAITSWLLLLSYYYYHYYYDKLKQFRDEREIDREIKKTRAIEIKNKHGFGKFATTKQ